MGAACTSSSTGSFGSSFRLLPLNLKGFTLNGSIENEHRLVAQVEDLAASDAPGSQGQPTAAGAWPGQRCRCAEDTHLLPHLHMPTGCQSKTQEGQRGRWAEEGTLPPGTSGDSGGGRGHCYLGNVFGFGLSLLLLLLLLSRFSRVRLCATP